jgi:SSS family solute:Na+ symporter
MVSGLFIPILAALYGNKPDPTAAILAMIIGGSTTVVLIVIDSDLPFGLDANIFGITTSAVIYLSIYWFRKLLR